MYENKFLFKADCQNNSSLKKFIIVKDKFCFSQYLKNIYNKRGEVMLYNGPDVVWLKIATAYNLLILLKSEFESNQSGRCNTLIDRIDDIQNLIQNVDIDEIIIDNKLTSSKNDGMKILWEEIQILF